MQLVKIPTAFFLISVILSFFACEKENKIIPATNIPTKITIDATVPSIIYSNKKEISMDASTMKALNGDRSLTYLWTCTLFPTGKTPYIMYPESASTVVTSLDTGKYSFHFRVKDNFGNEANADYQLTVYKDTLTGPPVIPPMPAAEFTMPGPVSLLSSNVTSVNPIYRPLKFNWTVIEQPAGSPVVDILNSNSSYAFVNGCVPGKYVFQLEVTNELDLKATRLLEVTVLADPYGGTSNIYDNLHWATYDDEMGGTFLGLYVREPAIPFFNRTKWNTEISFWDYTKQEWVAPNIVSWSGYDEGVIINGPILTGISDGTPGKVRIIIR
jgi:hypothetical protein